MLATLSHDCDIKHTYYHRNKFMNMINPCLYVTQALTALREMDNQTEDTSWLIHS